MQNPSQGESPVLSRPKIWKVPGVGWVGVGVGVEHTNDYNYVTFKGNFNIRYRAVAKIFANYLLNMCHIHYFTPITNQCRLF